MRNAPVPIILHPLLKSGEKFSKLIVPSTSAFNDPAARRVSPAAWGTFATVAEVGCVMSPSDRRLDHREVVPFVQAQVLRFVDPRSRPLYDNAVQGGRRRFHVGRIGGGHDHRQRRAALVGQRVALRAELAAISWMPVHSVEAAVRPADILIVGTTSREPVVKAEWVRPGTLIMRWRKLRK
jgi:hypothetical protein